MFSIITITYNSEKTVERTIKSVLAQTCKDYEYIIVDGASKDSTIDIVKKYEPLFEGRMKWKSEPDKGIYNAMNKGIERSSGEIMGIVNSDDWIEPNALSFISDIANNCDNLNNSVFCASMMFHYENGSELLYHAFLLKAIKIPAAHSPVNTKKHVCMVVIRVCGSASARLRLPIYIPTTSVTIAILVVCPMERIVASIDVATL